MSTEIETRMTEHTANEFWGGDDRGICLQVTEAESRQDGYIQLTMAEADALYIALGCYVKREATRRTMQTLTKENEMKKTGENYPIGPCVLPLQCSICGTIITEENVVNKDCAGGCDICLYCGNGKCPKCGEHWHCGGCV